MERRIREEHGDLFELDTTHSLAHCVSVDLAMSKGIAKGFRDKYRQLEELRAQNPQIGSVCYIPSRPGHYAFYLVTKAKYFHKPMYESLESSLQALKTLCVDLHVRQLAVPRLGCGLDKLSWERVIRMLEAIFADTAVEITVRSI
jgi:hypothetical protein